MLILGTLPGQASLAQQRYYAQPRNAFWPIMGALFAAGPDVPYDERAARLQQHGLAVWDVCRAAVRPGSLDAAIDLTTIVTNDFARFFRAHPRIECVCTNGAMARQLYVRAVLGSLSARERSRPLHVLPSTSPAHATLRFEQKLERWRLLERLLAG